jgi:PAS domain S-box-containing protein
MEVNTLRSEPSGELKGLGLDALLALLHDDVTFVDPAGRILLTNREGAQSTDPLSVDMTQLGDVFATFRPDGRSYNVEDRSVLRSITTGETIVDEEVFRLAPDGRRRSFSSRSAPIYDEDGTIVAAVVVARDVSERTRLQAQLAYLLPMLDHTEDAIIAFDSHWQLTAWNKGAERMYGRSAEEALGRELGSFLRVNVIDEQFAEIRRETAERGRWRGEVEVRREDGSGLSVEAITVAIRDADGEITGYVAIHRDISERKRAEEQVAYYASLLDNMDDAVLATDTEFVLTAWNRGAERMFGWKAAEALGHSVYELVPTDWTQAELTARLTRPTEGQRAQTEGRWYGKDGKPVFAESCMVPVGGGADRITGYLSILRGLSERHCAELALERRLRQQAAVAELGLKALEGQRLPALMDAAVTLLCRTLGVDYATVDRLLPDSEELLVSAGSGFRAGIVGIHRIPADRGSSPAGYALALRAPVIVEDISTETRFEVPTILHDYEVLSEVTVVIASHGNPFGTLAALSRKRRTFSKHDVSFVQSVANVIATAVDRAATETRLDETPARERAVLASLSLRALAGNNLEELLDNSVMLVADTLAVELSSIAQAERDGELSWRAAFGWTKDELADAPASRAGTGSLVGYTISVGEPVISDDVKSDKRFVMFSTFAERAPASAAAVVIPGPRDPFGALVVAAQTQRAFRSGELDFMQAVANLIGIAVDRAHGDERVEAAREAERRRIARDLHDDALRELTDALAVATMAQSSSAGHQEERRWGTLIATLQRGTRQLRSAIYDLRLSDEDRPFGDLLDELVAIQADLAGDCQLRLHGRRALGALSLGDRGPEVLRIVTEALTNARRHSGAATIRVDAHASSKGLLRLEVSDDGAWPDRESALRAPAATGLTSMFHRADALGAKLQIGARHGGGTTVSVELPSGSGESGV